MMHKFKIVHMSADTIQLQEAVYPSVYLLARDLGISRQAAYEGLRRKSIPSIRVGKRFIIPRAAIQEWLRTAGGNLRPAA